jgi:6-phosphogluconolactonase
VDFSLTPVAGSPFAVSPGDGPGPLAVDPFGNFLYVVDSGSSQLSAFRIGSSSGSLTSIGTFATGTGANSIAIRSDDTWIFVTSLTTSTLSEYAIVPASGTLAPQAPVTTFNTPTGVAVK